MRKTIDEKLVNRKIKKPGFMYSFLGRLVSITVAKKYNIHTSFYDGIKEEKRPYVLISNHASRLDMFFTLMHLLPRRFNVISAYNEFFRMGIGQIFRLFQIIPKRNFILEIKPIKDAKKIIEMGGSIYFLPEGMSSISGHGQPIVNGTAGFLKLLNVPVYYAVIKGGYLTSPKYNVHDRPGYVDVEFRKLCDVDELQRLSKEDLNDKINKAIYVDDYKWNKIEKHTYKTNGKIAEKLDDLLFYCPKCHKLHTMKAEGNKIYCTSCGNGATIDDTYSMHKLDDTCVIPETQTEWFDIQREVIKEQIKDKNYKLEFEVDLGVLPKYKYLTKNRTSLIVGHGKVSVSHNGFDYIGSKEGKDFSFHLDLINLPTYGMCIDVTRFYQFYENEYLEFYPVINKTEEMFIATEELHRLHGGNWQDYKFNTK